jgi:DNA-binding CsgD family transcriptional regulator
MSINSRGLSTTQRAYVAALACGLTPKQIAYRRGVRRETVTAVLINARDRLGAQTNPHLVARAIALGELPRDITYGVEL